MGFFDWFKPRPTPQPEPQPQPRPEPVDEVAETLLALHNDARQRAGLSPLRLEPRLMAAARKHAQWMAQGGGLTHRGFPGRLRDVDYAYSNCGENIAWNYVSPASCHAAWMRSPGHRRNIMGSFTEVGFAYVNSYWCADYGRPSAALPGDGETADYVEVLESPGDYGDTSSIALAEPLEEPAEEPTE